jgi:MerR family transcriptional regulator, light-induced transcriptional regulator
MFDPTPTFNLKVVVRETGLKPDTLRAWERRYGLPQPERTAGHHRLYSQRDIETFKWLAARQNEGLNISRAVELWRALSAAGHDPLLAASSTVEPVSLPTGGDALLQLGQDWLAAGLAFNEAQAERILSQAFALYPVDTVCFEVLQKGLVALGKAWYRRQITVQQEHFISELAVRRLEALLAATPPPVRPGRLLLGCPPQEEHIFSPLLLTLLLRRRGWDVVYLGANVPLDRIETTLSAARPQLVILVAQHLPAAATLLEMSQVVQIARRPLAFGGLIFNRIPLLRQYIPGHFLGENLAQAPAQVEQWLTLPGGLLPVETRPVSQAYRLALAHYREQLGLIEMDVWQRLQPAEGWANYLPNINRYLAQYIAAALTLGDLNVLNQDMAWLTGLLGYYYLPATVLPHYIAAYHQAVGARLDERGALLEAWLAQLSSSEA